MGRKHTTGRVPQQDRREANREYRRTLQLPFPTHFGIRRPVKPEVATPIVRGLVELQKLADIPHDVKLRPQLHATLMPSRVFGQQVLKGLVAGYNLNGLRAELRRKTSGAEDEDITAQISDIKVFKGKIIYAQLVSPEMEDERLGIAETMEAIGLRGLRRAKTENVLHMSLGESRKGISPTEQRHIEHIVAEAIDGIHGLENPIPFEHWETYPDLSRWQH